MKISLPSLIDKLETQRKRIENKHSFAADPIKPDYQLVKFDGEVISDYVHDADEEGVSRYCICVVKTGTFIDADRQRLVNGAFRLPCVDAMGPVVPEEKLNKHKERADKFLKMQGSTATRPVNGTATGVENNFTTQAEIDAARAEAKALNERELEQAYGVKQAVGLKGTLLDRALAHHFFGIPDKPWWE